MKRYQLDEHKDNIIELYLEKNLSCEKIAKTYSASLCGIYDALRRWGIKTRNLSDSHKKYSVDENYFNIINSEEKAYWLGFIYADGFLTKENTFGIALSIRDKTHLLKLNKSLSSTFPLNDYVTNNTYGKNPYVSLRIRNKILYEQLLHKGVKLNKSLILEFPDENILSRDLYRHFIRGYFDGDGSLILSDNSINFKICGTKEFLTKLIDVFNKNTEYSFNYKLYKRREDDKNNYYISYGGKNKTYSVLNFLYDDSIIYLDRKKEKYDKLIQLYNNRT